ncbi:MAG: DUF885 domain-containing protein [Candidatus Sericytochromatia bacterium]|nr:DUF885 domain-containing protein [Candidatus Tanganyikabacteria bacterium]
MRPIARFSLLAAAIALGTLLVQPARAQASPSQDLHALFRAEWDYAMEQFPTWASTLGDRRWNSRWEDLRLPAIAARYRRAAALLDRLAKFPRDRLPAADQVNFDLFVRMVRQNVREERFEPYLLPVSQMFGIQTASELASQLRFETAQDYRDWVVRLQTFPGQVDATIALMREGIARKRVHPKILMQRVPAQIDKQIVARAEDSPFFEPFELMPDEIPAGVREAVARDAATAIMTGIVPAFERFKRFFVAEYLPACFDEVGIWQRPDGAEYYAFQVWRETTTDLTPEQIHQIGLSEVARIRGEMEVVKAKTGFKGSLGEFFTYLRTDPRFYFKSPEELLAAYRALCKRIDPRLTRVFRVMPRMPYGVEPVPEIAAPDSPMAYYYEPAGDGTRPGYFRVNTYKPESRPRFDMVALALHEAVPGHHFQIALAMEQGDLPNFRKYGGYTAYTEGWGLYAESLGEDMGLYDDPYDKFGQLTFEMWRAVRLVVDTGIHHKRWPREQAIQYFRDNTPKSELDIANEVDRYIAWPGQALAYKIGELKIKELRRRATDRLGDRFDLRAFHDVVLRNGSVTLDVLERGVDAWIAGQRQSPDP